MKTSRKRKRDIDRLRNTERQKDIQRDRMRERERRSEKKREKLVLRGLHSPKRHHRFQIEKVFKRSLTILFRTIMNTFSWQFSWWKFLKKVT